MGQPSKKTLKKNKMKVYFTFRAICFAYIIMHNALWNQYYIYQLEIHNVIKKKLNEHN